MTGVCSFTFLIFGFLTSLTFGGNYQENYVSFLTSSVYAWYEKRIRPISDQSQVLDVQLSFSLVAVNSLDASSGTFEIVGILTATWNNDLLIFNTSSDWTSLGDLQFPQDTFWRPPLVIYNSANSLTEIGHKSYRIRIDAFGKHEWILGIVSKTACSVDVTNFPFDSQSCDITLTPWAFTSSEVKLSPSSSTVDMTHYSDSVEWTFTSSSVATSVSDGQSFLTFTISLKRSPGYFFVNLVMPVLIVAVMNILVFLLPAECGERVGYAVTVFLTFAVYLDIVSATLPKSTTTVAKLAYYLMAMVSLGALTTLMTIFSLYIYHKDDSVDIPLWLQSLANCLQCNCGKGQFKKSTIVPSRSPSPKEETIKSMPPNDTRFGIGSRKSTADMELVNLTSKKEAFSDNSPIVRFEDGYYDDESEDEEDEINWNYVANGLDYLYCFISFWITVGLSCYFLLPLAFL